MTKPSVSPKKKSSAKHKSVMRNVKQDDLKTAEQSQYGGVGKSAKPSIKCKKSGKSPRKHHKKSKPGKKKSHKKKHSKHHSKADKKHKKKHDKHDKHDKHKKKSSSSSSSSSSNKKTPQKQPSSTGQKQDVQKGVFYCPGMGQGQTSGMPSPQQVNPMAFPQQANTMAQPAMSAPIQQTINVAIEPNQQLLSPNATAIEKTCETGCQCEKCVVNQAEDQTHAGEDCKCEDCIAKAASEPTAPCPADCQCEECAKKEAKPNELPAPCPADCKCEECVKKAEPVPCPADCNCEECAKKKLPSKPKVHPRAMINEWVGFHVGATFPKAKCVQAMGRPLDTLPGESPDQYVGMAQIFGDAVMGRVWKDSNGKIAANFTRNGIEYKDRLGEIQILLENSDAIRGFDYGWQDFQEATKQGKREWVPLHVKFVAPCVLMIDGKELLGKVDLRDERGVVFYNGEEKIVLGEGIATCKVLCRKAKPGFTLK